MKTIDIVGQKIKGKVQQVKGNIEVASGQELKGNVDKLRGKANEIEADVKMKVQNAR